MKRIALTAAAAVFGLAGAVYAGSHGGNPVVKARQAHMQLYAFYMGQMGAMAKGEVEYNADAAQIAADNLASLVGMNQMLLWAPGTDSSSVDGSRAKADLWQNMDQVMGIATEFKAAADALAAAAGNGQGALGAAMGGVGAQCGACHKPFREPAN